MCLPNSYMWHYLVTLRAAARAGTQLEHWSGIHGLCGQVLQVDICARFLHHGRPKHWTCNQPMWIHLLAFLNSCQDMFSPWAFVSDTQGCIFGQFEQSIACPVGLGDGTWMLPYMPAPSLLTPSQGGILPVSLVSLQLHCACQWKYPGLF